MKTTLKSVALTGAVTLILGIGALAVAFPLIPRPWIGGSKSSQVGNRAFESLIQSVRGKYLPPIYASIRAGNADAAIANWNRYIECGYYFEDPITRLDLARFYFKKGLMSNAHEQVDKILNPPPGSGSTFRFSGEVMSIWLATSKDEKPDRKSMVEANWQAAAAPYTRSPTAGDSPVGRAQVEYMFAQELEALSKPTEAMLHYRQAVLLQPESSFLWQALSDARVQAGDPTGAREALAKAYWLASGDEREKIRKFNRVTDADLRKWQPRAVTP